MHYFATPLRPSQQTTRSLRASQYKQSSKRKRDDASEQDPSLAASASASPSPDTDADAAPGFPHHPLSRPGKHVRDTVTTNAKLQQSIAALNPPVYAANATSRAHAVGGGKNESSVLRSSHLETLCTLMHRCLLEGDYDRAARAWGMILRTQVAGQPLDPRNHGRWGIGAELLLRRRAPTNVSNPRRNSTNDDQHDDVSTPQDPETNVYTQHGLGLAQDYYERFIIQYPFRKTAPDAVDSRAFYPPLFTVWIKAILDQSEQVRKSHQESRRTHDDDDDARDSPAASSINEQESAIQAQELSRAEELCERLDQLITSPPFDKHAELLYLRGNVSLWISDLILGRAVASLAEEEEEEQHQQQTDWDEGLDTSENLNNSTADASTDKLSRYRRSLQELNAAREFFTRAEATGAGSLEAVKSSVDVQVKSVAKRMARYSG